MLKKLYNSFINFYYKKELAEAKNKIQRLEIDQAIFALQEISKKIHPKTDAIKKLKQELDQRVSFTPIYV